MALTEAEIAYFWAPADAVLPFIARRRTAIARFGLILHMGFLKMTGRSLSTVDMIPAPVLALWARYADLPTPQMATLHAICRRPKTPYAHQKTAAEAIGLKPCRDQALRHVTGFLRRQCGSVINRDELVQDAQLWLYDHGYLLPGQRPLEKLVAVAQTCALNQFKKVISAQVSPKRTADWATELSTAGPHSGETLLDWLRGSPTGFGRSDIAEM